MNEANELNAADVEHEMWYWLTKMRLANKQQSEGFDWDLGTDITPTTLEVAIATANFAGKTDMFNFDSTTHEVHDVTVMVQEADNRGEITDFMEQTVIDYWEGYTATEMDATMHRYGEELGGL